MPIFHDLDFSINTLSDLTKVMRFDADSISASTVRTYIGPDASGTLALLESGQTFSGANTFSPSSASDRPLLIAAHASQTADLFEISNPSTDQVFLVDKDGVVSMRNDLRIFEGADTSGDYAKLTTATLSANRTITIPDATGTLGLLESAQTWTGIQTFEDGFVIEETADHPQAPAAGDGQVWVDSGNHALAFTDDVGQDVWPVGCAFTKTSTTSLSNSTTETDLLVPGLTFPANFFVAGKTIRISMRGYWNRTTGTSQWRVKLGSTNVITTGAQFLVSTSGDRRWHLTCDFTCRSTGASGNFRGEGVWHYFSDSVTHNGLDMDDVGAVLDTTATQALTATFQWGTANAANNIHCTVATVEVLN